MMVYINNYMDSPQVDQYYLWISLGGKKYYKSLRKVLITSRPYRQVPIILLSLRKLFMSLKQEMILYKTPDLPLLSSVCC